MPPYWSSARRFRLPVAIGADRIKAQFLIANVFMQIANMPAFATHLWASDQRSWSDTKHQMTTWTVWYCESVINSIREQGRNGNWKSICLSQVNTFVLKITLILLLNLAYSQQPLSWIAILTNVFTSVFCRTPLRISASNYLVSNNILSNQL